MNYSPVLLETDVQSQMLGSATHSPPNGHRELHTTAACIHFAEQLRTPVTQIS